MAGPRTRTGFQRSALFGVAAGGVVLGHWLTYLWFAPHGEAAAPAADPHGYLWLANDVALAAALAATAMIFLGRLTRPGGGASDLRDTIVRLVGFQVGAFVAMEVLERASARAPSHDLLGLLLAGVAVQGILAIGGALLVAWLLRAADHVAAVLATSPGLPPRRSAPVAAVPAFPAMRVARHAAGIRGPPPSR
jgi:hypothetical protein